MSAAPSGNDRILIVGDKFIGAHHYEGALAAAGLDGYTSVEWDLPKDEQHALQQRMELEGANVVAPPSEVLTAVSGIGVMCLHFAPVGERLLRHTPDLRLVVVARAGLENVDVATATELGIGVVPSFGRNAGAVAELQIGLMLAETRNIARADASVRAGGWRKDFHGAQVELADCTVGMVGFGHVGRVFAERMSGFGSTLQAHDPYVEPEVLEGHGVSAAATLDDVFATSDFVVVMARHTAETDRMIQRRHLDLMGRDAYFINVSRSRLVDTDALYDVLAAGQIGGAGLDVFDDEPLPSDSRWRSLANVTMTTHFGGDTDGTNRTSARLVADSIAEFRATGRVRSAANADALGWNE